MLKGISENEFPFSEFNYQNTLSFIIIVKNILIFKIKSAII